MKKILLSLTILTLSLNLFAQADYTPSAKVVTIAHELTHGAAEAMAPRIEKSPETPEATVELANQNLRSPSTKK